MIAFHVLARLLLNIFVGSSASASRRVKSGTRLIGCCCYVHFTEKLLTCSNNSLDRSAEEAEKGFEGKVLFRK